MGIPRSVGDFFTWGPVVTTEKFYHNVCVTNTCNWRTLGDCFPILDGCGLSSLFCFFFALVTPNFDYYQAMKRCHDRTNDLFMNVTQPMDFLAGKLEKVRTVDGILDWMVQIYIYMCEMIIGLVCAELTKLQNTAP